MDALRSIDGVNEDLRPEILNDLISRWGRFFSREQEGSFGTKAEGYSPSFGG